MSHICIVILLMSSSKLDHIGLSLPFSKCREVETINFHGIVPQFIVLYNQIIIFQSNALLITLFLLNYLIYFCCLIFEDAKIHSIFYFYEK